MSSKVRSTKGKSLNNNHEKKRAVGSMKTRTVVRPTSSSRVSGESRRKAHPNLAEASSTKVVGTQPGELKGHASSSSAISGSCAMDSENNVIRLCDLVHIVQRIESTLNQIKESQSVFFRSMNAWVSQISVPGTKGCYKKKTIKLLPEPLNPAVFLHVGCSSSNSSFPLNACMSCVSRYDCTC